MSNPSDNPNNQIANEQPKDKTDHAAEKSHKAEEHAHTGTHHGHDSHVAPVNVAETQAPLGNYSILSGIQPLR